MAKVTDIMLLQQPEQTAIIVEKCADMNSLGQYIGEGFMRIGTYLKEMNELPSDIPFVEYPAYEEMTTDKIQMVIGFYTANPLPDKGDMRSIIIPSRKVVVCLHKGSYDELANLYNEMAAWIKIKGYEPTGTSVEHYYTGPEVPEKAHVTRVVMPLK